MSTTMHAVRVAETGGAGVMTYTEVAQPQPDPGEALVKVDAAGVNFIDVYQRSGLYQVDPPFTPGMEAAGTVTAVGDDVTDVQVGDRVAYAMVRGSYAEFARVPAGKLVPVPDDVPSETAAAVMLQGLTAHYLATNTYAIAEGDTALVHAGAGGVGLLLTQVIVNRGGRVITTVSTKEKAELSRNAGASDVIDYTAADVAAEVAQLTDGRGVQVVYDSVGKDTFDASLASLAPRGMLALFGQSSGLVAPFDLHKLSAMGSLYVTRPTLATYSADPAELRERAKGLFAWIINGELNVRVHATLGMADAAEAHRMLEGRQTAGKVLLTP